MAENHSSQVFIATATAHVNFGEDRTVIKKNVTRVQAGHPLLEMYPGFFKPADEDVRFTVENAVDRPPTGGKPGDGTVSRYDGHSKAALADEVENRNKSRDAEHQIAVPGRATIATLTAALEADDEATAAAAAEPAADSGDGQVDAGEAEVSDEDPAAANDDDEDADEPGGDGS